MFVVSFSVCRHSISNIDETGVQLEIAKLLVNAGANPTAKNNEDETPSDRTFDYEGNFLFEL